MEQIGKVGRLLLYPVKSMGGYEVPELHCTYSGVRYGDIGDRHWAVVTSTSMCLDGRMLPRLWAIKASVHDDILHLNADGMQTLLVPRIIDGNERTVKMALGDTIAAIDCGEEASQWLSKFLNREGLALMYAAPGLQRRHIKDDPWQIMGPHMKDEDEIVFHDAAPGNLVGQSSFDDVNSHLKEPVSVLRFRPNIVATDTAAPYAEDGWKEFSVGECKMSVTSPNPKCTSVSIDPDTGKKHPRLEPQRKMKTFRVLPLPESMNIWKDLPSLGVWFSVLKPGTIRVGDPIMAVKSA